MMPLRVAFVAGTLRVGGAEKQLTYMAQALANTGVEMTVFSLGASDEVFAERLRARSIPVWTMSPSRNRAVRLLKLAAALRRFRPDVIQSTHFYAGAYAAVAGFLLRTPVVGAVRNDLLREWSENGAWAPWLYRAPSLLIANSHAALANTARFALDAGKLRLISNVIALDDWPPPRPHRDAGQIVAIIVANLDPAKRLDRFIGALAIARRSCPHLTGVIVGSGACDAELKTLARARDLGAEALRFLGHRDDVPELMAQADLLCLTSADEGTPNAILEAMASSLPVIGTDVGDIPFLVEQGVNGYVVPEHDTAEIARRMVELAQSPTLRLRMGQAGRARVEREFSPSTLSSRLLDVYYDLAERRGSATLKAKVDIMTSSTRVA